MRPSCLYPSFLLILTLLGFAGNSLLAQGKMIQPASALRTNQAEKINQPYVLLISLDGYRYDYTDRFQPPNISRFINQGVQAHSLIPCYPSKTFPNHYSIATGMYPEKHRIVDNTFFDPQKEQLYKISDRNVVEDGSWYGGTPIWVQAARHGLVSASFFFVGSEADVQGVYPSYYYQYNGSIANEDRVLQVLDWLVMPEEERPHLITLYFSDMDDAGHAYGPNNDEKLKERLFALDATLGVLFNAVEKLDIPVNIIIVSDHGMADVPVDKMLSTEAFENDALYKTVSSGALTRIYLKEGANREEVYQFLQRKAEHFTVYKTEEAPYFKHNPQEERLGDLVLLPEAGYYFSSIRRILQLKKRGVSLTGQHGFDPAIPAMHGIFYAQGPAFKSGLVIPSFENVHIYPMMCRILGLPIPEDVDGRPEVLQGILNP